MAQSEGDLKRYFEGRKVKVLIDMPATKDGVNVYPERGQSLEFSSYAGNIKQFGIGVKEGESVMITKVRVKEKHIEFQLGGGGYGTAADEGTISQWTDWTTAGFEGKSKKEERLEEELKKESDANRRRELREQIDTLRRDREREDRRIRAERAASQELGKQRIEERRTHGIESMDEDRVWAALESGLEGGDLSRAARPCVVRLRKQARRRPQVVIPERNRSHG